MPKEVKTQADKRRAIVAEDQFGRPWSYSMEIENGEPTGLVRPCGWTDPMRTPTKYLSVPRNKYGQPSMDRMDLDLQRWIKDQARALRDWTHQYWEIGDLKYGQKFDPQTMSEDPYLLRLTGAKPYPSAMCIEVLNKESHVAYAALLGLGPMNSAARELLGVDPMAYNAAEAAAATMASMEAEALKHQDLTMGQFLALGASYNELVAFGQKVKGLSLQEVAEIWQSWKAMNEMTEPDLTETPALEAAAETGEHAPEPEPVEA